LLRENSTNNEIWGENLINVDSGWAESESFFQDLKDVFSNRNVTFTYN